MTLLDLLNYFYSILSTDFITNVFVHIILFGTIDLLHFFHSIFPEATDSFLLNVIYEIVKNQMAKLLSMCFGTDPAAL